MARVTKIKIDPGICGLPSVVAATMSDDKCFAVRIQSECPMVESMQARLDTLVLWDIFRPLLENPVYLVAAEALQHASCPVPSGILKCLEVAAEMALPKDVHMRFVADPEDG